MQVEILIQNYSNYHISKLCLFHIEDNEDFYGFSYVCYAVRHPVDFWNFVTLYLCWQAANHAGFNAGAFSHTHTHTHLDGTTQLYSSLTRYLQSSDIFTDPSLCWFTTLKGKFDSQKFF